MRHSSPPPHGFRRKLFLVGSCIIATFLVMTSFLHAVIPHHHPGEEHAEDHGAGEITFTIAHAHEEKGFFDLIIPFTFFVFLLFFILSTESWERRAFLTRKRSPPPILHYLLLLFSQGILHPKIP